MTAKKTPARNTPSAAAAKRERNNDALMVKSVEKAFRVLEVFGGRRQSLTLSQVADAAGMDVSAAQRFTHTLTRLGYLQKDAETKHFVLTPKNLGLGYRFLLGHRLVERAMPYLRHLSTETEEAVNLIVLDDTEIIFVARFMSRHMLNTNIVVGTRMPAYCSASGIAIMSHLPRTEALGILDRSDLRKYTPATIWRRKDLIAKMNLSATQGFSTSFGEVYKGDLSVASAILDERGRPEGAINVAVSFTRYQKDEVAARFGPMVMEAARAVSRT